MPTRRLIQKPSTITLSCQDTKDGDVYRVNMPAYATRTPGLVIHPRVGQEGWSGDYALSHLGTGRQVRRNDNPWHLRSLATALGGVLDWTAATVEELQAQPRWAELPDLVRAHELTEPTSAEHPAYDTRGPDGKGKGLKRAALPMATDVLAAYEASFNRTSYAHRDAADYVPMDVPDPEKPGETKPNRLWMHELRHQCDDYGLAFLLLTLHRLDPVVADSAAAALADAWESGDSVGEWAWQWADELQRGVPATLPGVPTAAEPGDLIPQPHAVDALFEAQDGVDWLAVEAKRDDPDVLNGDVTPGWAVFAMQDTSDPESTLAILHVEHATTADGKTIPAELARTIARKLDAHA